MQINQATQTDINAVLAQMRALRAEAQAGVKENLAVGPQQDVANPAATRQANFGAMFKGALDHVNTLQKTSSASANDFLSGKSDDLVKVMVDSQKSSLGFQAAVQVRNRVVSAYQDIMNMPI